MNSQQKRTAFETWGWKYDYVRRTWIAPSGEEISTDDLMEAGDDFEDDVTLMAIIVACGVRQEGK